MKKGHAPCPRCTTGKLDDAITTPQQRDIDMLWRMYVPGTEARPDTSPPATPPRLQA
jgi:hypothetical protein